MKLPYMAYYAEEWTECECLQSQEEMNSVTKYRFISILLIEKWIM